MASDNNPADDSFEHAPVDEAAFRRAVLNFLTHIGDESAELPAPVRDLLNGAIDTVPLPVVAQLATLWARQQLASFIKFVDALVSLRTGARSLLADDEPAPTPELAAVKDLLSEPGRLTAPQLNEQVDQLIQRLGHIFVMDMKLGSYVPAYTEPPTVDLFLEFLDAVRLFAEDVRPVSEWHAELGRALKQRQSELN